MKADDPYNLFDQEKFSVKLVHLMPGKVVKKPDGKVVKVLTKKDCDNSKFLSVLTVKPRHPNQHLNGMIRVTAKCAPMDKPSRKAGREVCRIKARTLGQAYGWIA